MNKNTKNTNPNGCSLCGMSKMNKVHTNKEHTAFHKFEVQFTK